MKGKTRAFAPPRTDGALGPGAGRRRLAAPSTITRRSSHQMLSHEYISIMVAIRHLPPLTRSTPPAGRRNTPRPRLR
jgi:hypothetical protein